MSEGEKRLRVTIAPQDAGGRLDAVLAARCRDLSRSRLQALIRGGRVALDGETISEPAYRVKPGQRFAVAVPAAAPAAPAGQAIPLAVLYEDAELIVVDKPAGLVVHPAPGNPDRTLVNALIAHCGAGLSGIGGVRRPGIVHRLDKGTSGLMVAAKTDRAHLALTAQFAARRVERAYAAIVWGAPAPAEGALRGNIGRSPRNRKKMAVLAVSGKPALTRYRVLARYGPPAAPVAARLDCRLGTGRTHQIRVHLAHAGHPVIGDPVYGGRRRARDAAAEACAALVGRQALHARLIGFEHPTTAERLTFSTDVPNDIKELIACLEAL